MATITVSQGNASTWKGEADAVMTHPYSSIPLSLSDKPMIINLYHPVAMSKEGRIQQAMGWLDIDHLEPVSDWGKDLRNTVYIANLPWREVRLDDLVEDEYKPNIGWFPLDLPIRMLKAYEDIIRPGARIADLFCGRGTVGKACQILGYDYIGLDISPERVALAREYLGLA